MVVIFHQTQPIHINPKIHIMPNNHRPLTSITRSISFDQEVFSKMEIRREALRLDRSTYIRFVLEEELGIVKRPLLRESRKSSPPSRA
jgi:hypothetical protein